MPSDAKHDVDLSPGDAITPTPTDATDAISPDDVPHNHPARPGAPKQVEPPLSTSNLTHEHLRKDAYAEHEQLTSMKRLLSKGEMLFDSELCADCALNGQFDTLKWARANKCPWDENTCANAALRGNLVILEWARANGCTWDTHTCANAARLGHLEVLKWARLNGAPWDEKTCTNAVLGTYTKPQNPARLFLRFRHLRFELFNTTREGFITIPIRATHAIRPNTSARLLPIQKTDFYFQNPRRPPRSAEMGAGK